MRKTEYVPVAQLDRASDSDSEGRRFEPFRARQSKEDAIRHPLCFDLHFKRVRSPVKKTILWIVFRGREAKAAPARAVRSTSKQRIERRTLSGGFPVGAFDGKGSKTLGGRRLGHFRLRAVATVQKTILWIVFRGREAKSATARVVRSTSKQRIERRTLSGTPNPCHPEPTPQRRPEASPAEGGLAKDLPRRSGHMKRGTLLPDGSKDSSSLCSSE